MGTTDFDFAGETVLVTGGSSGIGRALARAFADAGAAVVVADRRERPRDDDATVPTREAIERDGGRAEFVETDVSDPAQVETAVGAARELGGVDVMVNNAGVHLTESVLSIDPERFERLHAVNVRGCLFGCQAAARDMRERGVEGTVLNVSSISATMAKPEQIGYESTKGAIRMITRSAALELAPDVRVNAVAPGRTATAFGDSSAADKRRSVAADDLLKPIPMERAGTVDDVTGAALFLASDAAGYVTGEVHVADGGIAAQ